MKHHIAHLQFAQIQHAADHVAMFALDIAFLVMQFDRAADFLMRFLFAASSCAHAEQGQHPPHQPLHGATMGASTATTRRSGRATNSAKRSVRAMARVLGMHFGEDQDDHGHQGGGDGDGAGPKPGLQRAGHQRRGQDVDEGVAQQQRADQPLAVLHQPVDVARRRGCRPFPAGACGRGRPRSARSPSRRRRPKSPAAGR